MRNFALNFCRRGSVLLALCGLAATCKVCAADEFPTIGLEVAYPGLKFNRPLWMEEFPDGSKRVAVVEQAGVIRLLAPDRTVHDSKTFLDIRDRRPYIQNEEGLLAFAFHPQFKANRKCYLYYVQHSPERTVLSEVQAAKEDLNKADLASERILLEIPQPYWNHKGGTLLFGPDGFLYLSTGDGGLGGDPHNVGQSGHHLLAKILRLDVDSRTGTLPYGIPKDNPFVGRDAQGNLRPDPFDTQPEGIRPEIWAYGLRNVWRMSFDRETGDLWAADVGQDKWEEVDLIVRGGNYGWSVREGFHPFKDEKPHGTMIDPVLEYGHHAGLAAESKFPDHSPGVSITGGYVYRGKRIPALRGVYIYADYQMGTIWGFRYENHALAARGTLVKSTPTRPIVSFAEDREGELYVLSFDENIYQIVAGPK